jgi:hypothetical protein
MRVLAKESWITFAELFERFRQSPKHRSIAFRGKALNVQPRSSAAALFFKTAYGRTFIAL